MRRIARWSSCLSLLSIPLTTGCGGGGGGGTTAPPTPKPVASVTVTLSQAVLVPNEVATATAVLLDASGAALSGRAISWSSTAVNVATVDGAGVVTAVAPGSATISATSEGRTGQAVVTVNPPPVTSVIIAGSTRVKVGDSYQYVATARVADGTVVVRPVTWSVSNPAMGLMTAGGLLTPLQAGAITIQVTIDGIVWQGTTSAYDWETGTSGGSIIASLRSDTQVTNRFGTSEYPSLVLSCSSTGRLFLWVNFTSFVTHNGVVAYSFDGGTAMAESWDELAPSYSTLWYPYTNLSTRVFMNLVASSRTFGFAFSEFNSGSGIARAMIFRVTGLASRLGPILGACPSNSIRVSPDAASAELTRLMGERPSVSPRVESARQGRAAMGPMPSATPLLREAAPLVETQRAVRRQK